MMNRRCIDLCRTTARPPVPRAVATSFDILRTRAGSVALAALLLLAFAALPPRVYAGATLFVGNPPQTGAYLYNGTDVRSIGASQLGIEQNAGGANALGNPLLLILGVPNAGPLPTSGIPGGGGGPFFAPTITVTNGGNGTLGGPGVYGGSWDPIFGFGGSFDASASGSVYDFLGLTGPTNSSNSFTNWSGADSAVNGITARSFGIFVYQLTDTNINTAGGKQLVNVSFGAGLPVGTFAVAYGQTAYGASPGGPSIFDTPFTESGLVNHHNHEVPDPGTLFLIAGGMLALAASRRWWQVAAR